MASMRRRGARAEGGREREDGRGRERRGEGEGAGNRKTCQLSGGTIVRYVVSLDRREGGREG